MKAHLKEVGCITIHLPRKWPAGNNHPLNDSLHFGKYLFNLRSRRLNSIIVFYWNSFSSLIQCAESLGCKFKSLIFAENLWCETKVPLRRRILTLSHLSSSECNMSGHWTWTMDINKLCNCSKSVRKWEEMRDIPSETNMDDHDSGAWIQAALDGICHCGK